MMNTMNKRIERLRKRDVESERKVDIDRAVMITEAYKKDEDKPPIIAKGLALEAIFSQMPITVREDELIVGNLTKCLELALNDGKCMLTNQQMGPRTGEPEAVFRFEDLLEAFRKQIRYFVEYLVLYDNRTNRACLLLRDTALYF